MQLRGLMEEVQTLKVEGSLSIEVSGLAYEARRVTPGDAYFALERGGVDGHREIELAAERGAVAVVCRRKGALRQRATVIEVEDTRETLAKIAGKFYGEPGGKLHVVGISGEASAWKTAYLLSRIFRASGVKAGLISRWQHEIGERRLPANWPLESCDVQRLMAEMVRAGCGTCVLQLPEVSAEVARGIPLDALALTGEEQNLWRLSEFMKRTGTRRPACGIVNVERQDAKEAGRALLFETNVTFGFSSGAQVSAQDISYGADSTEGTLYAGNEPWRFDLPLIGRENVRALLAATAAALARGLTTEQIKGALTELRPVPGSLERVRSSGDEGEGFAVYVDEAREERSLEKALSALREITNGRILLSFGATEKTTGKERFGMGRAAARQAQYIVLTSDNSGREPVEQICGMIAQGIESAGSTEYHFQPDRAEAIRELIGKARPGDVLLISGKGDRVYQELASTIVPFDDRIVAAEVLTGLPRPRTSAARRELALI